ncbi:MAG TPA: BatA and WFA domain-containing protein [Methylomirabilota bacterium]|nr:BatA and WFA domain-containing protein [Methylomirabilota bacterium]
MNFLAPTAFAFAAAIPVVIVFYLLKRKRVVKLISSTLLWQKFLAETQANAPFQRLRHNWLLLLQILMLLLAVFALARPYFIGNAKSSRLRVLILDASASMQATDERPSRFERARAEAVKWVDGLKDQDQMVVLVASANTEVKQSATSDKSSLRRAIESSRPTDSPTRLREAFQLAETLIKNQPESANPEIHLFSDGAIPNLAEFENKNLPLVYHRIGTRGNNLGINSLDVRANPDNPAQRAIFTSIVNPTTNDWPVDVELRLGDEVVETKSVNVPATNTLPLAFIANQARDGVFTVRLNGEDDLVADNQASIVSILPRPVKVLLVTRGNRLLEKAIRPLPNVTLTTVSVLADEAAAFDVVVFDDVAPIVWPKGNVMAIHVAPTNLFPEFSNVEAPVIVDYKHTHPLLRFVSFDNVSVNESLAVKAPKWGVPLVESSQTPLLIAGEVDRKRVIWIGFDFLQSFWPYRTSFPIFLQNAMEWLNPSSGNASQFMVKAGEPFRFGLAEPVSSIEITGPDGVKKSIPLEKNAREVVFGDTSAQGIYKLRAGTNDLSFCVNLMDAFESDTRPRDELPIGKFGAGIAATRMERSNTELWRWIALAGLCVLLFEWWWYHKRTV